MPAPGVKSTGGIYRSEPVAAKLGLVLQIAASNVPAPAIGRSRQHIKFSVTGSHLFQSVS